MRPPLSLILILATCCGTPALAGVLLERSTATGMTLEPDAMYTRCTLDDNGQLAVLIRNADVQTQRVQQLQIGLPALRRAIAGAAAGTIASEAFPVDGPSRNYFAWRPAADGGAPVRIVLRDESVGGERLLNEAPAARKLINVLDANCGPAP